LTVQTSASGNVISDGIKNLSFNQKVELVTNLKNIKIKYWVNEIENNTELTFP
jgi:hypothetical protein